MIAFGCVVSEAEAYRRYAEPGIALAREPDSRVYPFAAVGTLGRSCNLLCESAAACEDLEALVIVHPHAQLDDRGFLDAVRHGLSQDGVELLGVLGGRGDDGLAWWRGTVSRGQVIQRHHGYGGGELPAFDWARPEPAPAPADGLDGFVVVLSAWAVRELRFDERAILGHAVHVDLCRQVQAAGRRTATIDARVIEHRELELVEEPEMWVESHIALADKWSPAASDEAWRRRARRAEAEREAARTLAYSRRLVFDMQIEQLETQLQELTTTPSWRLTRPLRELNLRRRRRAATS